MPSILLHGGEDELAVAPQLLRGESHNEAVLPYGGEDDLAVDTHLCGTPTPLSSSVANPRARAFCCTAARAISRSPLSSTVASRDARHSAARRRGRSRGRP